MAFSLEDILGEFVEAQHYGDAGLTVVDEFNLDRDRLKRAYVTKESRKRWRDRHTAQIKAARAATPAWKPQRAPAVAAPPHALRRWG